MGLTRKITVHSEICGGRPCIRGLRIRVKDVLDLLAAGASHDEILDDDPVLDADDIQAVLEFAARESDDVILQVAGSIGATIITKAEGSRSGRCCATAVPGLSGSVCGTRGGATSSLGSM